MVTGVLFLALVLLTLLLVAFVYEIVTTPLTAVDAPTLMRSAAAPPAPAPELLVRQPRTSTGPAADGEPGHTGAATRSARRASPPETSRWLGSWGAAALAVVGLVAAVFGGLLFVRISHGEVCARHAIEVCSQGFVLLTGAQLAGGAIAVAGISSVLFAIFLTLRYYGT